MLQTNTWQSNYEDLENIFQCYDVPTVTYKDQSSSSSGIPRDTVWKQMLDTKETGQQGGQTQ